MPKYISPISMIVEDTMGKIEESVWKAVVKLGFDIDKEELRKALAYDRDQYRKGYEDGKLAAVVHAHWIEDGYQDEPYVCSNCGWAEHDDMHRITGGYCVCCGAKMDEEII